MIDAPQKNTLSYLHQNTIKTITYKRCIIATGARELFLPFPGWILPDIYGAGGLQAMVKSGLNVKGKRIIIAGSGPLLLAVAAYLKQKKAKVLIVAEQATFASLAKFTASLCLKPNKLLQAGLLKLQTNGIKYRCDSWIKSVKQSDAGLSATLLINGQEQILECDYIANAYGLVPNLELPQMLGCQTQPAGVFVNKAQETSIPGIYAVGETTGIGGLDLSLIQGQIAGYDAVINTHKKMSLYPQLKRDERFAIALNKTFQIRKELKELADDDTIICRCEDVPLSRIKHCTTWREAKLQTRCGMGPCQGRICGPALHTIKGLTFSSVRPPIFPVTINQITANPED